MVEWLKREGLAEVFVTDDKFLYTQFVSVVFINDKVCILDVRDDANLPIPELEKYPNALVFKANYSSELWDNPPETFEYKIPEEEKKWRKNIRPFVYGRAFRLPFTADERAVYRHINEGIRYELVSYTGAGCLAQQTKSRLEAYDWLKMALGKHADLVWYDRNHFIEKDKIENYDAWAKKYAKPNMVTWHGYENHLKFISTGRFSLNIPGIAVSQPFRCIDAIMARRCIVSTKIWIDAWKDFPCIQLPVCGYFGSGNWEVGMTGLIQYLGLITPDLYNQMLHYMNVWYDERLTAKGMWENQFLGAFHE